MALTSRQYVRARAQLASGLSSCNKPANRSRVGDASPLGLALIFDGTRLGILVVRVDRLDERNMARRADAAGLPGRPGELPSCMGDGPSPGGKAGR